MDPATKATRHAAETLVEVLQELLAVLATGSDDVDWLRGLAVLSAEIEYSGVRGPTVDALNLAEECRDVEALLVNDPPLPQGTLFASRYPRALLASSRVESLHRRALAVCRDVAEGAPGGFQSATAA